MTSMVHLVFRVGMICLIQFTVISNARIYDFGEEQKLGPEVNGEFPPANEKWEYLTYIAGKYLFLSTFEGNKEEMNWACSATLMEEFEKDEIPAYSTMAFNLPIIHEGETDVAEFLKKLNLKKSIWKAGAYHEFENGVNKCIGSIMKWDDAKGEYDIRGEEPCEHKYLGLCAATP